MLKNFMKVICILSIYSFFPVEVLSQFKSPDEVSISTYSTVSTEGYQPLWLASNRGGIYEEFSNYNVLLGLNGRTYINPNKKFDYAYGAGIIAKGSDESSKILFNELYLSGKIYIFQFDIGRKNVLRGENPEGLSSGSFGLGNNTIPIPKISVSIPEFTPIPYTHRFLQFKGNLAHGWLENDRFVKNAYLHEKTFYLKGGYDSWPIQAYAGMVHFAQWGGTSPRRGKLPSSIDDFVAVTLGKGGGSDAPGGEQINALGNHLGIWDFGLKVSSKSFHYQVYWQHYFEDYSGLMFRNIGDGLWGIGIQKKESKWLSGIVWEILYTKDNSGPGETDRPGDTPHCEEENCGFKYGGRDDYYNNFIYRSGWTYMGRNLGNPLLMSVTQLEHYKPNFETYNSAIESNRILAHHVGLEGQVTEYVGYKTFITYVRHYGNYKGLAGGEPYRNTNPPDSLEDYEFYPPQSQWNFMLETNLNFPQLPQIDFSTTLAWDTGDLTNNGGLLFGATWTF